MKKFTIYILLVLLPLVIIFSTNIIIDSRGFINHSYINSFVSDLGQNHLAIYGSISERLIAEKRIKQNRRNHFNKVVIGSSRAMLFGIPIDEKAFNLFVSGAGLEDCEILVDLLKKDSITFDTIIVIADPWFLNKNRGDEQYKLFKSKVDFNSLKSMLSWEYALDNITLKRYLFWDGNEEDFVRYSDGSIRYDKEHRENTLDISNYVNRDTIYQLGSFEKIDKEYLSRFARFLSDLKKEHFVELLLVPYHPAIYEELARKIPVVREVESIFYGYVSDNVSVKGSYNPNNLGLDSLYFYDAMHINEAGMKKLYKK